MIADPPLREFSELTGRPHGRIDLARAALAIARWEYPRLDAEPYLDKTSRDSDSDVAQEGLRALRTLRARLKL